MAALEPDADGGRRSLVEVVPLTGRSHQIRVHLAWLGCPVHGDALYGGPARSPAGRLWLHAAGIVFPDPRDGSRRAFAAPLCLASSSRAVVPDAHLPAGVGRRAESRTACQ